MRPALLWRAAALVWLALLLHGAAALAEDPPQTPATQAGSPPQAPMTWTVEVLQGGQVVTPVKGSVTLARAPFTLRFTMPAVHTVALHVQDNPQVHKALRPGMDLDRCDQHFTPFCPGTGMAEHPFARRRELMLDDQGHHHLYFRDVSDHRWSRVIFEGGRVVMERDVEFIGVEPVPLAAWGGSALYLAFMVKHRPGAVVAADELQKLVVRLKPSSSP